MGWSRNHPTEKKDGVQGQQEKGMERKIASVLSFGFQTKTYVANKSVTETKAQGICVSTRYGGASEIAQN